MLHQGYWLFEFISISSVINKARGQYERSFLLTESDDNDLTCFLLAHVKLIQQTARSDLQKLAGRGMLMAGKDGRREIFRVPGDLAERMPV